MNKNNLKSNIIGAVMFIIVGLIFVAIGVCLFIDSGEAFGLLFVIPGGIAVVAGFSMLFQTKKNVETVQKLMQSGASYEATIVEIEAIKQVSRSSEGRMRTYYSYIAHCRVIDPHTNEEHIYKSEPYLKDLNDMIGTSVIVYVDYFDDNKYYVDMESVMNGYKSTDGATVYDFRG